MLQKKRKTKQKHSTYAADENTERKRERADLATRKAKGRREAHRCKRRSQRDELHATGLGISFYLTYKNRHGEGEKGRRT